MPDNLIQRASLVARERLLDLRCAAFNLAQPAYRRRHPSDVAFLWCKHPVISPFIVNINTKLGVPIHILRPGQDFSGYRRVLVPNGRWPEVKPAADRIPEEKRVYCEVGFFPQNRNIYFDAKGVHGHSSLRDITLERLDPEQQTTVENFRAYYKNSNFVKMRWDTVDDRSAKGKAPNPAYNEPFVFVPLQMESDTAFDLCPYESNQQIIDAIERQLPGKRIVFKVHPWDLHEHYRVSGTNLLLPRTNRDLQELLQRCESVVNSNSTVMLEALLYGKKCASLGTGFTTNHNLSLECHENVERLRELDAWQPDQAAVDSFLFQLIARQVDVHFWKSRGETTKLRNWLAHYQLA